MREPALAALAGQARDRLSLWTEFLRRIDAGAVAEIGVYRGAFAEHVLDRCDAIRRYYMIDPWRHLDAWNKPANRDDATFERIYEEAMTRTADHAALRVVLRGRTTEVIDEIADGELDFAYVDGDHTLRGITIDLVAIYPKVRPGGWIGGDDFARSIWQHGPQYEPTMVFPLAVHFAEAVGARVYGLPFGQFLIEKQAAGGFEFVDLTGKYGDLGLLGQMRSASQPPSGTARSVQQPESIVRKARRRLRGSRSG